MEQVIAFKSPLAQPWHQLALEIVMLVCFALTLRHAMSGWKTGRRYLMFDWLVALSYGIAMELIAFTWLDNYTHAQFTVQLYHHKLPLYVTALYVIFHYTGLRLAERQRAGLVEEALLAGLFICLIDVPFDLTGIAAGWWTWSDKDPNLAARWAGVPVTSFYWYLTFGAIMSALCRLLRAKKTRLWLAPPIGLAVIPLGAIAFLPFHGLRWLGVPAGVIVAVHAGACVLLALRGFWRPPARQRSSARSSLP